MNEGPWSPRRGEQSGWSRALGRTLIGAMTALALLWAASGAAAEVDDVGILWMPGGTAPRAASAVVIVLHDSIGMDSRGWLYGEQITAAGMAVLHVELLETSADGGAVNAAADDAATARARLALALDRLAADPRFADSAVGLLAIGGAGRFALAAAAHPAHRERIAGLALLYPGCAELAAATALGGPQPWAPVLLLHGDADPANRPDECTALAALWARAAPVRRREYAGAGHAWDLAPHGRHEVMRLPWPGRPGVTVAAHHLQAVAELSATHLAAFFAASLAAHRQ